MAAGVDDELVIETLAALRKSGLRISPSATGDNSLSASRGQTREAFRSVFRGREEASFN